MAKEIIATIIATMYLCGNKKLNKMSTLRLEIRKDKIDKNSMAPVYLVYQIQGTRKYFPTGVKSYPENWDTTSQEFIYLKKGELLKLDVVKLNDKLSDLKRTIEKIEERFSINGIIYTPEMVLNELNKTPESKPDSSSKELFSFIDKYITDNELLRVKGSLSVYKSLKSHLQGFEQKTKTKVTFDKINYQFFQGFQNYLVGLTKKDNSGKINRLLNNITISKILSTLKTFLNYAKRQGIKVSDEYRSFTIKRETDLEVISLTRNEFETLVNLDLSKKPAWARVCDLFIFSCSTGLRFSDLQQLKHEHIKGDNIELKAIKTGHKTVIPLNPFSRKILKKYVNEMRPLPTISNQKANEHLAKICDWAGINEPIEIVRKYGAIREAKKYPKYDLVRMHCGRKTFATLSLEAGMTVEQTMKIGAWTDFKSFQRYMNLSPESSKDAMDKTWGKKIFLSKLKAV